MIRRLGRVIGSYLPTYRAYRAYLGTYYLIIVPIVTHQYLGMTAVSTYTFLYSPRFVGERACILLARPSHHVIQTVPSGEKRGNPIPITPPVQYSHSATLDQLVPKPNTAAHRFFVFHSARTRPLHSSLFTLPASEAPQFEPCRTIEIPCIPSINGRAPLFVKQTSSPAAMSLIPLLV